MMPHPIIMHVMYDDRCRDVQAEVTRRQLLDQEFDQLGAASAPQDGPRGRVLAFMELMLGRPKSNAAGARI